jgi:S-DNA-T family DNA segregation ATPase FtsK/SpoIIIE
MLRVQRERVLAAQAEQTPRFASMRRDERAVEEAYNDQDPLVVAGELATAAGAFTQTMMALDDAGWVRTGVYPWPAPQVRTVEWIGRRTVHELAHHLFDNRRLLG